LIDAALQALLALVACIVAARAEYVETDDVVILTASNFDSVIKSNKFVLAEFYAPWCGHCKSLEPHFKEAATALKAAGSEVVLAAMDATAHGSVAGKVGIKGYPTLKWFRDGIASEYNGGRTADTIAPWIEKHVGAPSKHLASADDIAAFLAENELAVIGFFAHTEGEDFKFFEAVASSFDEIPFGYSTDTSAGSAKGLKKGTGAFIQKPFDDKKAVYDDKVNYEKLTAFVENNRFPLVVPFSDKTANRVFQNKFGASLIVFSNEQFSWLQDLAEANKHRLVITVVPDTETRLLEYIGVAAEDYPTAFINDNNAQLKYKFEGEVTKTTMKDFISKFFIKKLKPFLKSEPLPEDNSGPVKTVVSKNFDEIVLDRSKHVFIEFYAPWCGHCKALAPLWEELGNEFADNEDVVIAQMDATANEVVGVKVSSYPTLYYYSAGKKTGNSGKKYEGEREYDDLKAWIVEKAGIVTDSKDEL